MIINNNYIYIKLYTIIHFSKHYKRLIHIHTGFNDYSFFWSVNGVIKDLLFIRIQ